MHNKKYIYTFGVSTNKKKIMGFSKKLNILNENLFLYI